MKQSISIVGLGYVGLCTAVCFASRGFPVYGVDIDREKVSSVRQGRSPIFEPQLKWHLTKGLKSDLLTFTDDIAYAVDRSDCTFISVGTPSLADGSIDLSYVKSASKAIGGALAKKAEWHLIVVRSTVVPGTCERVVRPEIEAASGRKCGAEFGLCMNPEFLKEGSAIHDTLQPDRVIIGEFDRRSGETLARLYRRFFRRNVTTKRMNLQNAELSKYANNAYLAMKISFANMTANLCESLPGSDVRVVTETIGLDRRIGPDFLHAGLGYGGSCFPKDIMALLMFAKSMNIEAPLIHATMEINKSQPLKGVAMGEKLVGDLSGKRIAVLGLAFKPESDDMRGAVSIPIIEELLRRHAEVVVYDPKASEQAKKTFGDTVTYAESATDCIRGSDLCILVTEWADFRNLKPSNFKKLMRTPAVVDGRRIFDPQEFSGIKFAAIGLGSR